MIYTHALESFSLYSQWSCMTREINGSWTWVIINGPSSDGRTLNYPVSLPADAVISRAWLSMEVDYPSSGAAYFHVNGEKVPASGEVDIKTINAETKSFDASFSWKGNGAIFRDVKTHTSQLRIISPTLNIQYFSESESTPEIDPDSAGNIIREREQCQLMRLLDREMGEIARISAKVSLDLQLDPLSTATMEIPWGQPDVHVRDFVELFTPTESAGIFRVSKVETQVGVRTKVWLKHALVTLDDDITVGVHAMEGTFAQVIASLLTAQSVARWRLGDVELPDEYTVLYSHGYRSIRSALSDILGKLPIGYYLQLDTLHYPWIMNLRALPADDLCEGRMRRNLKGVSITRDDRDLCTRVYPYGAGEGEDRINLSNLTGALFMDADTQDAWGTVTTSFTEDDVFDAVTLQEVARLYLERRKNPLLSVTLDAINLASITGETLDKFYPGRLCRLALPGYDILMDERVISISYPDVYGQPGAATVTLANRVRDSFDDLANLVREASASKLIGGNVTTEELKNEANGVTSAASLYHPFQIDSTGNLLSVKVRYKTRPSAKCRVIVDGTYIDGSEDMPQPVDILRYLKTDANGLPTEGEHYVEFYPVAAASVKHYAQSTIIIRTIEKQ